MTLKGQGQSLTSGQVRPRSRDDRHGSYCISLDLPGQDERTDTNPTSLSLFDQKLLANDGWWPRVTSNDLSRGRQCNFLRELSTTVLYDMITLKYAWAKVNITELIFFPLTYMGRSQNWPDLRSPISKIRDINFVGTDELIIFWKFHNFPWNIVAVARLESYFVVGSLDLTWWPDLTWHWIEIFTKVVVKMGGKVGENQAALRATVFSLASKNLRGGGGAFKRPPSRARVNPRPAGVFSRMRPAGGGGADSAPPA